MTIEKFMDKARRFCAWRERCSKEVEEKLKAQGAKERQIVAVIDQLGKEGFIDNQRFAKTYVRAKFENNRWGKVKIKAELMQRNISNENINNALGEIDEENYKQTLRTLIIKKIHDLTAKKKDHVREKTAAYCIQKGYEPSFVWETLYAED